MIEVSYHDTYSTMQLMQHSKTQLLNSKIETTLRQIILKDLEKGRKEFDRPHTEAVVFWMKHLLTSDSQVVAHVKNKTINPKVMITAAYAHDWGYIGLFENTNSSSFEAIKKRKQLHMKRGSAMIEQLLYSRLAKQFTDAEILQVSHLVSVHDKIEQLKTEPELLLMEADTLGMLDISRVKPSFSKKDNDNFMKTGVYGRRLPAFKHSYALEIAHKLASQREEYYSQLEK